MDWRDGGRSIERTALALPRFFEQQILLAILLRVVEPALTRASAWTPSTAA
jgi:hypothetical protein